jgi:hypothetical protein
MGRTGKAGAANGEKLYLRRVRIDSGGYDSGGAYWGLGAPLFAWENVDGDRSGYLRAANREAAKAALREQWDDIRFFN